MMDVYIAEKNGKQMKQASKKKTNVLVWIIGLAGIGGLWYYNKKKKQKELTEAQERFRKEAETQPQDTSLPPVAGKIVLPLETSGSAESRLRAMGEDWKGANPTARQEWRQV